MKRGYLAVLAAFATMALTQPCAVAGPLVLSKLATGHILPNAVSLQLQSTAACDETQKLIPDGSTLVSRTFVLRVDDKGIGVFSGPVQIVTPDGRPVFAGMLHGTVGLISPSDDPTKGCHAPGHLAGMLNGMMAIAPTASDPTFTPAPMELNFVADEVQEAAGVVPMYKGHLIGLIPTLQPPPPRVHVRSVKAVYAVADRIVALIENTTDRDIQSFDGQSYCTIVRLEKRAGSEWRMVAGCPLAKMPSPVVIKAGTTMKVALPEVAIPEFTNDPGTYRMVVDWQFLDKDGKGVGDLFKAVSPIFIVVAPPPPVASLKVAPDRPAYRVTDPITAIIANGPSPVRILDEQTLCTIVQLQREDGSNWVMVDGCPWDRMPIPTYLKPFEVKRVALAKNSSWAPGKYRLAVTFSGMDAAGNPAGPEQTALSTPFLVGAPPPVILTSDKAVYRVSDPIIATIANTSNVDVVTWDHQSFCTVLNLQRKSNGNWRTVEPCLLMTPTRQVWIKAGTSLAVTFPPDATTTPKWYPGIYRLQGFFSVLDSAGLPGESMTEVASVPFSVGAITTYTPVQTMETDPVRPPR